MTPNTTIDALPAQEGEALPPPEGKRPTILQVLPRLITGGVERGTVEIAAALGEIGWNAVVASEGGHMVRELERVHAKHVTLPLASKSPRVMRRNADALVDLIRAEGVDLVHARSRAPAWSALWAARSAGVPFVTTFHGTYNLGLLGLKKRYNKVMASGDRVIAISRFIKDHIVGNYDIDESIVRVIHRGVDFNQFDPERVSAERMIHLTDKWRLPDDAPVIMLPGRLTRWKGQLLLIEALRRLRDLKFRCLLVGSDQGRAGYKEEVEAAIKRAGLADRVQAVDDCRDMPAAYMVTDVVVSASTDPEGFGRVAAEGQAMGRPVIAPNHGAAPEIVKPGVTGWLFIPGDPETLADALRKALSLSRAERQRLAEEAQRHVRRNFSKEAMCGDTLAVYRELLTVR